MKMLMSLLSLFFVGLTTAQERIEVAGEIEVPASRSAEGITVFNTDAKVGTLSDLKGQFKIQVKKGDTLFFNSVQYQDFSVVVDQGIVNSGEINVFVNEAVNELPEVIVRPYDLSGNVRVDVAVIPVVEPELPVASAAQINPYEQVFRPDELVSPPNAAMREGMIYSGGVQFANIFRHIFTTRNVTNQVGEEEDMEELLMMLRNDDFFDEHLNIPDAELENFIRYAESNGLQPEMLQPENEMDLISFLVASSQEYKKQR